jgi:hypothetical protein
MKVMLKDVLKDVSYTEGGYSLFLLSEKAIENEEFLAIDMADVGAIPTLFMNTSFGDLMAKYGVDKIKQLFLFNNVTRVQMERIKKYFNDFEALYNVH